MTPRNSLQAVHFLALAAAVLAAGAAHAQIPDRITQPIDSAVVQPLPNHHPLWAVSANDAGALPADLPMGNMTLVLARSPQQEEAFEQLLSGQRDPGSPDYRHRLTSDAIGERFGLSENDIAAITGWLQSQGLLVTWVAPSRVFIGFSGSAADVGRAFQTELHYYKVHGEQRISVASDPLIPAALAPAVKSIRGLYTIEDRPYHFVKPMQSSAPDLTITSGGVSYHYLAPGDFAIIYDLPAAYTGAGTIGIVAQARSDPADFDNFKSLTGATFSEPTELIPTAYGGIDPGPPFTTPTDCSTDASYELYSGQGEATLDVMRAGSVAPGASLLSVVASAASGGIGDDAQYLVQSTPVPAQVMSISFGTCELEAGESGVDFWDVLFQQAAGEGISVFVSSPAGAVDLPTFTSSPSNGEISVTGTSAATATLYIVTTPATVGANRLPAYPGPGSRAAAGTALACILLFCVPARRRSWRNLLGMVALLVALAGGFIACGGSSSGGGGGGGGGSPGTTSGTYTITVTATSGLTSATGTVSLDVQ